VYIEVRRPKVARKIKALMVLTFEIENLLRGKDVDLISLP
jgi:hypothetical protein